MFFGLFFFFTEKMIDLKETFQVHQKRLSQQDMLHVARMWWYGELTERRSPHESVSFGMFNANVFLSTTLRRYCCAEGDRKKKAYSWPLDSRTVTYSLSL